MLHILWQFLAFVAANPTRCKASCLVVLVLIVEWSGCANMIRPMTSNVSALSSVVAKSHQAIHFVSSAPSIHSVRRVFPSTAGSQPCPPAPFRNLSGLRLTQELPFTRFWPFLIQASETTAVATGPWLSTVYHVRACKRYYGLIRQSDELRPAWLYRPTLAGLCPCRAVRLTFPSLAVVYGRACPSRGLPRPESALQSLLGRHQARRPNLRRRTRHRLRRSLDPMLRRQALELHRNRPGQRHRILVSRPRHRRGRPQRLERPRQQTRLLNSAQFPGRGWRFRPGPAGAVKGLGPGSSAKQQGSTIEDGFQKIGPAMPTVSRIQPRATPWVHQPKTLSALKARLILRPTSRQPEAERTLV